MNGIVKWYNEVKGYGFIQTDNDGDIFVHRSGLDNQNRPLEQGEEVEFDKVEGEKGPIAVKVKTSR